MICRFIEEKDVGRRRERARDALVQRRPSDVEVLKIRRAGVAGADKDIDPAAAFGGDLHERVERIAADIFAAHI